MNGFSALDDGSGCYMVDEVAVRAWDAEYAAGRYSGEPPVGFVDDILAAAKDAGVAEGLYIGCGNGGHPGSPARQPPGSTPPAGGVAAASRSGRLIRRPGERGRDRCAACPRGDRTRSGWLVLGSLPGRPEG